MGVTSLASARIHREPEYEPVGAARPSTPEMALHRLPGEQDGKYVSVVDRDDLASFQRNGHNGNENGEEDIDFTPQNGYVEPDEMEYEEVGPGRKLKNPKKTKQQPALMGKIAAAGSAIKKARLPTPMELKEGYLNSAFHKSLHQPLIVKSKVEKEDVRVARQALTQEKSPTALGNINSVSDIPIPKVFSSKPAEEGEEPAEAKPMPRNMDEWGQAAYNTLPKSFREQNIVTAVKENLDPEELARNQELTRSKTPAELAQIHSLSEFPVPENIKKFLTSERKADNTTKKVCVGLGQTDEEGKKFAKFDDVVSKVEEALKTPDSQGTYADYVELLKLYDKNQNGTMMLAELDNILCNLGDEIPKEDVRKMFAEICDPEDEDGLFPYMSFLDRLTGKA